MRYTKIIPSIYVNGSLNPDFSTLLESEVVLSSVLLDNDTYQVEIESQESDIYNQIETLQAQIDALLILLAQDAT